jgi:hypothetical protein
MFLPKKTTVLETISEIFKINKKNVMITTCKSKKESSKNKISKIKDYNWKTVIDTMEFVNISFMHF